MIEVRGANRFIDGPITPTLARFALPLLTTNFLHALTGTWGAVWVSHVLGANALTAVTTANVIMFMMMAGVMGIGTAAGVAIGQSLGASDPQAVKRVVGCAMACVMVFSVLFAVGCWLLAPSIIASIGTPLEARDYAITHLRFTGLSMLSIFNFIVMLMMMRGSGDARTPFKFTLVWIALTLLLGPLLLTGSWGLPKLGIAGLGVGSLLANGVALLLLVAYVYVQRLPIALHGDDIRHLRPDPVLASLLLRRGLPMAMEGIVTQGAYFVLLGLVNGYGAATTAAYSGAAQLWTFVQMPANAMAASMSAMVAINIGAGRWDRVEQIAWRGCGLSLALATAVTILMYALGDIPLRLVIPEGGPVLEAARRINFIALWGWIALSLSVGLFAVVRANGAMLAPTLLFGIAMWGFRVPFAVWLKPWLGDASIFWSFPFGSICAALLAIAYYRWGGWRSRALMLAEINAPADDTRVGE